MQELPSGRWKVVPPGDLAALRDAVTELSSDRGTYWTFNPLPAGHAGTVRVGDVTRRHNLMIDVDPIKAPGREKENATDQEHEAARAVAAAVREELTGRGWPEPAVIDSGNGWYLFYRVDLPNTPHSRSLLKAFLADLAGKYTGAIIDPKVINANRVAKVPGTWASKGPHSAERPHRLCPSSARRRRSKPSPPSRSPRPRRATSGPSHSPVMARTCARTRSGPRP